MNHSATGGISKRWVMAWTVALWALGTLVYAYINVASGMALPDAVGYDRGWSWQLFFFALVRLPILILVLGALLCLETLLWSRRRPSSRAA